MFAAALAAAFFLTSCIPEEEILPEIDYDFSVWVDEALDPIEASAFALEYEERTGLKVELIFTEGGDTESEMMRAIESADPAAAYLVTGTDILPELKEKGLVANIDALPAESDDGIENLISSEGDMILWSVSGYGFVCDTRLLDEVMRYAGVRLETGADGGTADADGAPGGVDALRGDDDADGGAADDDDAPGNVAALLNATYEEWMAFARALDDAIQRGTESTVAIAGSEFVVSVENAGGELNGVFALPGSDVATMGTNLMDAVVSAGDDADWAYRALPGDFGADINAVGGTGTGVSGTGAQVTTAPTTEMMTEEDEALAAMPEAAQRAPMMTPYVLSYIQALDDYTSLLAGMFAPGVRGTSFTDRNVFSAAKTEEIFMAGHAVFMLTGTGRYERLASLDPAKAEHLVFIPVKAPSPTLDIFASWTLVPDEEPETSAVSDEEEVVQTEDAPESSDGTITISYDEPESYIQDSIVCAPESYFCVNAYASIEKQRMATDFVIELAQSEWQNKDALQESAASYLTSGRIDSGLAPESNQGEWMSAAAKGKDGISARLADGYWTQAEREALLTKLITTKLGDV